MKNKDAYTDLISPYVKLEPINIDTQESTDIDTLKQNCIDTLKQSGIQDNIEVDSLTISSDNQYTYTIRASGDNGTYTYTYTPIATTQEYRYNDINTLGLWTVPPEEDYLTELEVRLKSGEDSIHIMEATFNRYRNEIMDLILKYKYTLYKDLTGESDFKELRKIS